MSRRNPSGFTGANAIPLGSRNKAIGSKRQFSGSPPRESYNRVSPPKDSVSSNAAIALKAAQAAAANLAKLAQLNKGVDQPLGFQNNAPSAPQQSEERGRPRKKKSRWSTVTEKTEIPGMPAAIASNLTAQQQKAYIVQLQIEDITRKIKAGDLGIPANPEERSPSPEPIYNGEGKRMNTREYRTRKKLEEERHKLIQQMQDINADYKPPMDYKPMLQRVSERVMIPQDLNPNINFVGLLIGPRGNTLKKIEKESNCKIMIRGKGSVKEGKIGRKDGQPLPGEDEPLHALVSGTSLENVQGAVKEIQVIIKQGIEQPEENNDLRKLQLMELAKLNGTLREDLMPKERQWLKPENQNVTNTTVCTKCGGRGHLEQDCRAERPSMGLQQPMGAAGPGVDRAKMDSEYMSLMAELGEGPPPSNSTGNTPNQGGNTPSGGSGGRGGFNNNFNPPRFGGSRPPWGGGSHGNSGPRFGGGRGGRFNNSNNYGNRPPMMNQNQPPPPWMQNGPYGGPPNNQWGGPPMGGPYGGGYGPNEGDAPPWMQGDNNMGPPMFDPSGGGNFYNQPPPPPPSNNPQPPPPPAGGSVPPWQQGGDGSQGNNGSYNDPSMMGYGGNMPWGGNNNMTPGPVPPPMPTGPNPVPPPPPGGDKGGMDYGNMGYGGYMAPPPPPPI